VAVCSHPPQGRQRRAKPSSPAQHHVRKSLPTNRTPFHVRGTRRFPKSVSYHDPLTSDDARFLTRCHLGSVSNSCHFWMTRLKCSVDLASFAHCTRLDRRHYDKVGTRSGIPQPAPRQGLRPRSAWPTSIPRSDRTAAAIAGAQIAQAFAKPGARERAARTFRNHDVAGLAIDRLPRSTTETGRGLSPQMESLRACRGDSQP
jgi:hypothetical protein